jgi:hypothetical protein
MSRKKISTTIYVTPEQSERLRLLHERTKVPVAVYIREGIDLVLRQYGHLLPGQLPLERTASANTPEPPAVEPRPQPAAMAEPRGTAAPAVESRAPAPAEPRDRMTDRTAASATLHGSALHKG